MANPPIHPYEAAPRVAPISTDQLRPEWKATLDRIPGAGLKGSGFPGYVFGELMRSPEIFGPFLEWWVTAKSAMALSNREQELVILRMGRLYSSDYVWKHHLLTAREFGAKPEEPIFTATKMPTIFCPARTSGARRQYLGVERNSI